MKGASKDAPFVFGMKMIERFRRLNLARKLILVLGVLVAPLIILGQVAFVTGSVFENGQKFGIVVTSWTVLLLAATLAWKAAK